MEKTEALIDKLRTVRHFQKLTTKDLFTIVTSGSVHRHAAGMAIYDEATPGAGMFVLIQGKVHLCKYGPQGQATIMSVIEPVIMFNEITVLDGGPNPATAVAVKDCLVWQILPESFQALLQQIPQVGLSLLRVLATRNRQLISHYEDLSFRSVIARTAKLILDLSGYGRHPILRRDCGIEEMARRIASVPEAISRSLNIIKGRGLIQVDRREIRVLEVEKLTDLAQIGPGMQ
jgi:CRP/FNR family transcriptional regulator